ncbi:MAG: SpoIIE family protein phosphatase [bacterium]
MKKKLALITINIIVCYILFFRINQYFYYTLIIPFLLTLVNTDNKLNKYYFLIFIPLFYFNIINATIIVISYTALLYVYKNLNIRYLYLTSFILSVSISLIFKYYFNSTFSLYAPLISLIITTYQLKFRDTPNEVLIFLLISQIIIIDNPNFILITLIILFLYIIYNNTDYLFLISFLIMTYHFYITSNYIVLVYPLMIYFSLKKEILFAIIIDLLLIIYTLYINELTNETILSIVLVNLLILQRKDKRINTGYFPMLLESFNNEIMSFCSFLDNFKVEKNQSKENFTAITNNITQNFCISCPKRYDCFGNEKLKTYEQLKLVIKNNNNNSFSNYCIYATDVIAKIYKLKSIYPISFDSKNQSQINGLSQALREYSVDLASKNVDVFNYYTKLKNELIDYGFTPLIFEPNCITDGIDLKIGFEKRFDNIVVKLHSIAQRIIKEEISVRLVSNNTMYAYYVITNKIKYNVLYENLSVAKSNFIISGDNLFAKKYDNGYFKAAIADGMGSGFDAFELSKETISLVEKISNQHINDHTSINILNTFYSLNDHYDVYSTLDYISLNLKTGKALIYKMGATTTFIISNNKITPIYNNNLPFGIDDLVTKEEIQLQNNDLVIMISDGVTEHIDEQKLTNYLHEIKNEKPHKIVYDIMQKVYEENNQMIKDDMSIIALKLLEI